MILKQNCIITSFFKSLLNVIKKDKKKEISKEKPKKKKTTRKRAKKKSFKVEEKEPVVKTKNSSNMQMPAPWSRVEKYKRIKKENY